MSWHVFLHIEKAGGEPQSQANSVFGLGHGKQLGSKAAAFVPQKPPQFLLGQVSTHNKRTNREGVLVQGVRADGRIASWGVCGM